MAVADAPVIDSAPAMLDEAAAKTSTPDGVEGGDRDEVLRRPTPTIAELDTVVDENDSTATITSTASSVFANSISGFLINRRFQQDKYQSPARMASFSKNLKHIARVSSRNLNVSLARSKLYNSFPNLSRKESQLNQGFSIDDENVRKVLKAVESDHVVSTHGADNRNRRTVYIEKLSDIGKFGFTIQSYTLRHSKTSRTEQITYVDYVDLDSPAFIAGLRAGDIILAINGRNVQNETHQQLVAYIGTCSSLRMVVLFQNCVSRIELCARAIKLKKLLADKEFEFRMICCQEQRIISGAPPFTDVEILSLLRTPCNTPRSVSFSLPDVDDAGSAKRPRMPSAPPPRSTNDDCGSEGEGTTPRADDSKRDVGVFYEREDANNVIHYMDVEDVTEAGAPPAGVVDEDTSKSVDRSSLDDVDMLTPWEMKKANFVLGSEAGSSARSSSRRSSFRRSGTSSTMSQDDSEETSSCRAISEHRGTGDDLALIHILHIDDAPDDSVDAPSDEASSVAITHL